MLLDTHVVFWWLVDAPLDEAVRTALSDPENVSYVSVASAWEVDERLSQYDVSILAA